MKKFLCLLPLVLLTGCSIIPHIPVLNLIYSGPTHKETQAVSKAQSKTDKEQAELEAYQQELSNRVSKLESNKISLGSAFVYGTGKALDRATNTDPAVSLAKNLNDAAQQALPKPSTSDTIKMDNVVSDSLGKVPAQGSAEVNELRERLAKTEKQLSATQEKYNSKIEAAREDRNGALVKERAESHAVAEKANKFDEANSLWGSFKLFFSNGIHLFISLVVIGIVGWVVWKAGKIAAAIYCPPVALGMNSVEGMTSKEVAAGFSQVVKGGKKFLQYLNASPLTSEVKTSIANLFTQAHKESQDENVKNAVKALVKSPDA